MKFPNSIAEYCYGSRVYGTAREDSDYDYIIVADQNISLTQNGCDYTFYSEAEFLRQAKECEISVLECLFLPDDMFIGKRYTVDIDLSQLRKSISQKTSNSWVKAKKKFEVEHDYYIARKSLWHSFRILMFGIQIAKHGKIIDFSEANYLYGQIIDNPSIDWNDYYTEYKKIHNKLSSDFRLVAPK